MPEATEPQDRHERYPPIGDYALIGDCGSAALVSRAGSIDWLCWPRFDSPSLFGALLDAGRGGRYRIAPTAPATVTRRYLEGTNVLETTFRTESGVLRLIDLMTVSSEPKSTATFRPEHEVLRWLVCDEGCVEVAVSFDPRFDYGRKTPRVEDCGALGFFYRRGGEALVLRSELPLQRAPDGPALVGCATLHAGAERCLALAYNREEPAVLPTLGPEARRRIDESISYWRRWSAGCTYDGPYRDSVLRSALTLKMLSDARTGAVIAAPTTSLPEVPGGSANWDYRYCWVRDASFTLRALFELGFKKESEAFFHWLLNATRGRRTGLSILYDLYGNTHVGEKELDHLEGYRGARPVRIGNAARQQFQLDMYGELVSASYEYVRHGGSFNARHRRFLIDLGNLMCRCWDEPDNGIWEVRGERRHHTYSIAMCWVGLTRLVAMHRDGMLPGVPVHRFESTAATIRSAIEERGYDEGLQSYVASFGGERVDATLLLLPIYGYQEANHPRMRTTFARIQEELGRDGLLYRYLPPSGGEDAAPHEGAFGICSFWDEEYLALSGDLEAAKTQFEHTLSYANDVGLFSEEIEVSSGRALGNFPQAFTHVGLINAALTIAEAEGSTSSEAPRKETAKNR